MTNATLPRRKTHQKYHLPFGYHLVNDLVVISYQE